MESVSGKMYLKCAVSQAEHFHEETSGFHTVRICSLALPRERWCREDYFINQQS